MPSHSNFSTPIQKNLKHHHFNVEFINSSPEHIKRIKLPLFISAYSLIRKLFFADLDYKAQAKQLLKYQIIQKEIQTKLSDKNFDHVLVIRPDLFNRDQLQLLKKSTKNYIGYQWNGLNRFPNTLSTINLFNRFFIFDNKDLFNSEYKEHALLGTTNFYFDMYKPEPIPHQGIIAYFVGLHFDERTKSIKICAEALESHGITLDFNIRLLHKNTSAENQYYSQNIKLIHKNIEFNENIQHINKSDILVDIVNPIHNGLSFRTFEALYYEKKLITNNMTVTNYDFYHPNNILVWDGLDISELSEFLKKPFIKIDDGIKEKYSFHNWIKNILNIPPFQKIELPIFNID